MLGFSFFMNSFNLGKGFYAIIKIYQHGLNDQEQPLSISRLHLKTGFSYSYIVGLVKQARELGLLTLFKDGREQKITLTDLGKEVAAKALFLIKVDRNEQTR